MVFLIFIHSFSYFFYYTNHVDMASLANEKRLDHSLVYRAFFFIFASSSEPGFLS